jgi:hypothetical protein
MSVLRDFGSDAVSDAFKSLSVTHDAGSTRNTSGHARDTQRCHPDVSLRCSTPGPPRSLRFVLWHLRSRSKPSGWSIAHSRPRTNANAACLVFATRLSSLPRGTNPLLTSSSRSPNAPHTRHSHFQPQRRKGHLPHDTLVRVRTPVHIPRNARTSIVRSPRRVFFQTSLLDGILSALPRGPPVVLCPRVDALPERSYTNRHLAELWLLEAEWTWTEEVGDVWVRGSLRR